MSGIQSLRRNIKSFKFCFAVFIGLTAVCFFLLRPLNDRQQPVIAGDGLGYYAWLPAQFIYGDDSLSYRWFNAVHEKYYTYSIFPDPEDNFVVEYNGRRINKYYPGLSIIWSPFFFAAHVYAQCTGNATDGFSTPYQAGIGVGSLFYLLLGLWLLRKLLLELNFGELAGCIVPVLFLAGSRLYAFGFYVNALTHIYSFCFITGFLLFVTRFSRLKSAGSLLWSLFFFLNTVFIRPANVLILIAVPAFVTVSALSRSIFEFRRLTFVPVALILITLSWFFVMIYQQTGKVIPYTYPGEGFTSGRLFIVDALLSYHMGLFVYAPIFLLSIGGFVFLNFRQRLFTTLCFLSVIVLYSAWWYWLIIPRGLIDYYAIPAIWLGALIGGTKQKTRAIVIFLSGLSVAWYQLKNYQLHAGVLDHWMTSREVFWRNFFRTDKAWTYPVPEVSVRQRTHFVNDFESAEFAGKSEKGYHGHCLRVDSSNYITQLLKFDVPEFARRNPFSGVVRLQMFLRSPVDPGKIHFFINFFDHTGSRISEQPIYLNEGDVPVDNWDLREFGFSCDTIINKAHTGEVVVWNIGAKVPVFVDNVRIDFYEVDGRFETNP